jgi:hypothetical protein
LAFLLKLLIVFAKIVIITLFFEKNANFFAENCRKSQKIVIITSTPGHTVERSSHRRPKTHCLHFAAIRSAACKTALEGQGGVGGGGG